MSQKSQRQTTLNHPPAPAEKTITVVCTSKQGRRRAGIRFNKGGNKLNAGELDAKAMKAIEADPFLSIKD